jgi:hypothetical protein
MALTKTITLKNNFGENSEFPDAYLRVDRVDGSKREVVAQIGFYKEVEGAFLLSKFISFSPSMDNGNFIAQAYEHLKTLPEFADAVDC